MSELTAENKVRWLVLNRNSELGSERVVPDYASATNEAVEAAFEEIVEAEEHWDAKSETREGEVETGLKCDYSRHYESKAVAAQFPDGSWVGWTYWYGGGKHGEPEAMDWIEEAYNLNCTEEEKTVVVRTFTPSSAA